MTAMRGIERRRKGKSKKGRDSGETSKIKGHFRGTVKI